MRVEPLIIHVGNPSLTCDFLQDLFSLWVIRSLIKYLRHHVDHYFCECSFIMSSASKVLKTWIWDRIGERLLGYFGHTGCTPRFHSVNLHHALRFCPGGGVLGDALLPGSDPPCTLLLFMARLAVGLEPIRCDAAAAELR